MPLFTRIIALATVALVALSSFPAHVNALVPQAAGHIRAHDAVAKHRRDASSPSTCKPRPSPPSTPTAPSTPAPTPTTPPSTPSPTPSPPSTPAAPNKKWGLAWGDTLDALPNFANLPKVKYFYDWRADLPTQQLQEFGLSGYSMLWGWNMAEAFANTVVPGYSYGLVGPNEPEMTNEANMSPTDAVELWKQYMIPHKGQGFTFASPCTTNAPIAMNWTQEFYQLCMEAGCQIDQMCLHIYDTDPQPGIDFANWLHNTFNLPVIITEFACQDYSGANTVPSLDAVKQFAYKMVAFIDNTEWIYGAYPFGVMSSLPNGVDSNNMLIDANGQPTELATIYFG